MIIGLTSLCLYNSMDFRELQYGKLYKLNKSNLYNMQKTVFMHKNALTEKRNYDTIIMLGCLNTPFFCAKKGAIVEN